MRIKVKDKWYEASKGAHIMVELTDSDKANLANMLPECSKYAQFADDDIKFNSV